MEGLDLEREQEELRTEFFSSTLLKAIYSRFPEWKRVVTISDLHGEAYVKLEEPKELPSEILTYYPCPHCGEVEAHICRTYLRCRGLRCESCGTHYFLCLFGCPCERKSLECINWPSVTTYYIPAQIKHGVKK